MDYIGLLIFIFFSTLFTIGVLGYFKRQNYDEERKNKVLKVCAILTIVIHYSSLYVDYFTTGSAKVSSSMLLPVYPCNLAMWLLTIVAFTKKRNTRFYKILTEMTFYIGVTGGILGICLNESYFNNLTLFDWDVFSGLLSHLSMLIGCLYLFFSDCIKIRVTNVSTVILSLLILATDGVLIMLLFALCGLEPPNTMYLLEPPIESLPFITTWILGALFIAIAFAITITYEHFKLEEKDRFFYKYKDKFTKKK